MCRALLSDSHIKKICSTIDDLRGMRLENMGELVDVLKDLTDNALIATDQAGMDYGKKMNIEFIKTVV